MGGLPIVTGGVTSSSLPLPPPIRQQQLDESSGVVPGNSSSSSSSAGTAGTTTKLAVPIGHPLVAVGTDEGSNLAATMTVSYVEITDAVVRRRGDGGGGGAGAGAGTGAGDNDAYGTGGTTAAKTTVTVVAEVRVSVSPLGASLSKFTREASCRVKLSSSSSSSSAEEDASACAGGVPEGNGSSGGGRRRRRRRRYRRTDVCPTVAFSSDGRYVSCLVPHPMPIADFSTTTTTVDDDGETSVASGSSENAMHGEEAGRASGTRAALKSDYDGGTAARPPPSTNTPPSLSSLLIFTLKRPARSASGRTDLPPLPDAASSSSSSSSSHPANDGNDVVVVPVPSNPRSVTSDPSRSRGGGGGGGPRADRITSICPASSSSSSSAPSAAGQSSVLLAGTADGSVLAIGYRRAKVAGILYRPAAKKQQQRRSGPTVVAGGGAAVGPEALVGMDHMPPPPPSADFAPGGIIGSAGAADDYSSAGGGGRLATVRADGSVVVYRSLFVPASSTAPTTTSASVAAAPTGHGCGSNPPSPSSSARKLGDRADSDRSFRGEAEIDASSSAAAAAAATGVGGLVRTSSATLRRGGSDGSLDSSVQQGTRCNALPSSTPGTITASARLPPSPSDASASTADDGGESARGGRVGGGGGDVRYDGDGRPPPPSHGRTDGKWNDAVISVVSASQPHARPHHLTDRGKGGGPGGGAGLMMKMERLAVLRPGGDVPPFARAAWIDLGILILLGRPFGPDKLGATSVGRDGADSSAEGATANARNVVAQVWTVGKDSTVARMASLRMTCDGLDEVSHGSFRCRDAGSGRPPVVASQDLPEFDTNSGNDDGDASTSCNVPLGCFGSSLGVHRDQNSDCLALSSAVVTLSKPSDEFTSHVTSRFATRNGETFFAGTSTDTEEHKPRDVLVKPFVCIWDWRNAVLGMTLTTSADMIGQQPSIAKFSQLFFSNQTNCLVHIHSNPVYLQKDTYEAGLLSPPTVDGRKTCSVEEASPLLLSRNYVAFPFLAKPRVSQDSTVFWKESQIPAGYTLANGPPRIAAIGRRIGRSIAISSSRGVCILDLSRMKGSAADKTTHRYRAPATLCYRSGRLHSPCVSGFACSAGSSDVGMKNVHLKWRLFGSETEEQAFSIIAMTWWERSSADMISEDLLVAAIEYLPEDKSSHKSDQYYLVCWSRRRLGMGQHQLLGEASDSVGNDGNHPLDLERKGIALPRGLKPEAISLLAEPSSYSNSGESNRAVILVSSSRHGSTTYMTFQMQALDPMHGCCVLSRLCSTGRIPPFNDSSQVASSAGGVSSPFIAGASFQFDLAWNDCETGFDTHAYVATIGLIWSCGGGVDAVCITPYGPSFGGSVIARDGRNSRAEIKQTLSEITNYWLSDTIGEGAQCVANSFVWTITRNDGKTFCWSCPFFLQDQDKVRVDTTNIGSGSRSSVQSQNHSNKALHPPKIVPASTFLVPRDTLFSNGGESQRQTLLGSICYVGDSSVMSGSSTNDNEVAIGPLPLSPNGCILYAGQRSRNLRPRIPDAEGTPRFLTKQTLKMQVFGISDCIVGPPTIATSLFASFLVVASSCAQLTTATESHLTHQHQSNGVDYSPLDTTTPRAYIKHVLCEKQHEDIITSALRVVILRTVDLLSSSSRGADSRALNSSSHNLAKALLFEVVSAAKSTLSPLKFCLLFLSLGRQMEPHDFDALFPLPNTSPVSNGNVPNFEASHSQDNDTLTSLITIEDLFVESITCGSISVTSAALPLFSSKTKSLHMCKELFHHCLKAIGEYTSRSDTIELDRSVEEMIFIGQLYQFGLKLEDVVDNADSSSSDSETYSEGTIFDEEDHFHPASPSQRDLSRANRTGVSRIVSMITPILWSRTPTKEEIDERAISEAASMFIYSVFDETEKRREPTTVGDENSENPVGESEELDLEDESVDISGAFELVTTTTTESPLKQSMAGIVCKCIIPLAFPGSALRNSECLGWKNIANIAQLLVGTTSHPTLHSIGANNLQRVVSSISSEELTNVTLHQDQGGNNGSIQSVVPVLLDQIRVVSNQLNVDSAIAIFELVLSLLLRHNKCDYLEDMRAPLILVGVVVGHVSNRMGELLGNPANDCAVGICHAAVVAEMEEV